MGFLELLTKNGREKRRVNNAYEECYEFRKAKLLSFRKNAIRDVLFKYPDACILINPIEKRFMVLLVSQSKILKGVFSDIYYPQLDYCDDFTDINKKRIAIRKFRSEVKECKGTIAKAMMSEFKDTSRLMPGSPVVESLRTKGYGVSSGIELEEILGGALFLNERLLAKSTIWNSKPKGYFGSIILKEIVENMDRRPGIQVLTLLIVDGNHIYEEWQHQYEIFFDKSINHFDEINLNDFTQSICNLRDFLYKLEDYFHMESPVLDKQARIGLCDCHEEASFNSIDRSVD